MSLNLSEIHPHKLFDQFDNTCTIYWVSTKKLYAPVTINTKLEKKFERVTNITNVSIESQKKEEINYKKASLDIFYIKKSNFEKNLDRSSPLNLNKSFKQNSIIEKKFSKGLSSRSRIWSTRSNRLMNSFNKIEKLLEKSKVDSLKRFQLKNRYSSCAHLIEKVRIENSDSKKKKSDISFLSFKRKNKLKEKKVNISNLPFKNSKIVSTLETSRRNKKSSFEKERIIEKLKRKYMRNLGLDKNSKSRNLFCKYSKISRIDSSEVANKRSSLRPKFYDRNKENINLENLGISRRKKYFE